MATKSSIEQLNSFLRGEISAVETYRIAIDRLDKNSTARSELAACMRSHQERVDLLRGQISALGGEPVQKSGPWGVFAKTVEGGAALLGDKVSIAALEEGEDHGLKDYRSELDDLDAETRRIVTAELLPRQLQTHRQMSNLKKQLS
jgi:uncharacterized protein DUF2383